MKALLVPPPPCEDLVWTPFQAFQCFLPFSVRGPPGGAVDPQEGGGGPPREEKKNVVLGVCVCSSGFVVVTVSDLTQPETQMRRVCACEIFDVGQLAAVSMDDLGSAQGWPSPGGSRSTAFLVHQPLVCVCVCLSVCLDASVCVCVCVCVCV